MLGDDIADLLSTGGLGTVATNIFVGQLPVTPALATGILETGGYPSIHTFSSESGIPRMERPRIQLTHRAETYDVARFRAHLAWHLLEALPTRVVNSRTYYRIEAVQSPAFLEYDENDRPVFVCNYDVMCAPSTTTSS